MWGAKSKDSRNNRGKKEKKNMKKSVVMTVAAAVAATALIGFSVAADGPATGNTTVKVTADSTISLTYGSDCDVTSDQTVTLSGTIGSVLRNVQTVCVSTNSDGYELKIGMVGDDNSLYHEDDADDPLDCDSTLFGCITAVVNDTLGTAKSLIGDDWGYNIVSDDDSAIVDAVTTFLTVPVSGSDVKINESSAKGSYSTYVVFGAKPTASIAAGDYKGQVKYTATATVDAGV
jgi:hypothetical protein